MSPYIGWSTVKLLQEQLRLLGNLQELTQELNSQAGHATSVFKEILDGPEKPRKEGATARRESPAGSDKSSTVQTAATRRKSWGKLKQPSVDMQDSVKVQLPDQPTPLKAASSEQAKETPVKRKTWASKTVERSATSPATSPPRAESRGRSPARRLPTTKEMAKQAQLEEERKKHERLADEFREVLAEVIDKALANADWHVGHARMLLILQKQFPEQDHGSITNALKKAGFDPAEARRILLVADEGSIADIRIPRVTEAGRGLQWGRSRSPSPAPTAQKDPFGLSCKRQVWHTSKANLMGVYSKISEKALADGESLARKPEPPKKEIISDRGQERMKLYLSQDGGVTDLGFDELNLPPESVIISDVRPGSWAARLGVEAGSELLLVNDTPVKRMRAESYLEKLDERPLQLVFRPPTDQALRILHEKAVRDQVEQEALRSAAKDGSLFSRHSISSSVEAVV